MRLSAQVTLRNKADPGIKAVANAPVGKRSSIWSTIRAPPSRTGSCGGCSTATSPDRWCTRRREVGTRGF